MSKAIISGLVFLLAIMFLFGCALREPLGPAYIVYPENRPIEIALGNSSFAPNHLVILKNQAPFTFRLINTTDRWHSFTLVDSNKSIVFKKDLKPKESTTFTIQGLEAGNYRFYSDRFLCWFFRMEGMLMVE